MGGGLMQLVAYGAQDIYLTGNPQITFFKVVYRRHTNFAVESIEQTINGSIGTTGGGKVSVTVARNGDLLHRVYIQLKRSTGNLTVERAGFDAINYVEVEVGGQVIDKHYGQWMKIWCDLTHPYDKKEMLKTMLLTNNCDCSSENYTTDLSVIPLQFWFCRNPGLALPLIALQYHEVKLNIKFCTLDADVGAEVWCDYIFLDTDERRRFAQVSHEYLIEQVQYNNGVSAKEDVQTELRFNHPVKELIWQTRGAGTSCCNSSKGVDAVCSALLQLNGHDRFRKRTGEYFSTVQRYEHHSGAAVSWVSTHSSVDAGTIYSYSFALKPEEHQPSGTCNFSRIDNAVLNLGINNLIGTNDNAANANAAAALADGDSMLNKGVLDVYAVNYNVLRIMSGMGGLAYSN